MIRFIAQTFMLFLVLLSVGLFVLYDVPSPPFPKSLVGQAISSATLSASLSPDSVGWSFNGSASLSISPGSGVWAVHKPVYVNGKLSNVKVSNGHSGQTSTWTKVDSSNPSVSAVFSNSDLRVVTNDLRPGVYELFVWAYKQDSVNVGRWDTDTLYVFTDTITVTGGAPGGAPGGTGGGVSNFSVTCNFPQPRIGPVPLFVTYTLNVTNATLPVIVRWMDFDQWSYTGIYTSLSWVNFSRNYTTHIQGGFQMRGNITDASGKNVSFICPTTDTQPSTTGVNATCSDGVQNQGEDGVDCGGPCLACSNSSVFCPLGRIIGDVSGDGLVGAYDSSLVQMMLGGSLGLPSDICCVDVSQNGVVDSNDSVLIQRITVGLDVSPGVCGGSGGENTSVCPEAEDGTTKMGCVNSSQWVEHSLDSQQFSCPEGKRCVFCREEYRRNSSEHIQFQCQLQITPGQRLLSNYDLLSELDIDGKAIFVSADKLFIAGYNVTIYEKSGVKINSFSAYVSQDAIKSVLSENFFYDGTLIYLPDYMNDNVKRYDSQGNFEKYLGEGVHWNKPKGVIKVGNNIFVTNTNSKQIVKLTQTGQLVTSWTTQSNGNSYYPFGISTDGQSIIVAGYNSELSVIQKYNQDGNLLKEWIMENWSWPRHVQAINGKIYVSAIPGLIEIDSQDNIKKLIDFVNEPGRLQYSFRSNPFSIDSNGNLYIIVFKSPKNKLLIFKPTQNNSDSSRTVVNQTSNCTYSTEGVHSINQWVQGTVSFYNHSSSRIMTYTDTCINNTAVLEGYCLTNHQRSLNFSAINCPRGCVGGLCEIPCDLYTEGTPYLGCVRSYVSVEPGSSHVTPINIPNTFIDGNRYCENRYYACRMCEDGYRTFNGVCTYFLPCPSEEAGTVNFGCNYGSPRTLELVYNNNSYYCEYPKTCRFCKDGYVLADQQYFPSTEYRACMPQSEYDKPQCPEMTENSIYYGCAISTTYWGVASKRGIAPFVHVDSSYRCTQVLQGLDRMKYCYIVNPGVKVIDNLPITNWCPPAVQNTQNLGCRNSADFMGKGITYAVRQDMLECSYKNPPCQGCTACYTCDSGFVNINGVCTKSHCTNNIKDGDETDVDCGGSCSAMSKCQPGRTCKTSNDCAHKCNGDNCMSQWCDNGKCSGFCGDGVKEGTEPCDTNDFGSTSRYCKDHYTYTDYPNNQVSCSIHCQINPSACFR